jgi:hypothetical protein
MPVSKAKPGLLLATAMDPTVRRGFNTSENPAAPPSTKLNLQKSVSSAGAVI